MRQVRRPAALAATILFAAGCSSGLGRPGAPGFLPASDTTRVLAGESRARTNVGIRLTVPHRRRASRISAHPSTISAATESVSVAVNGGSAQTFNVTPTSPNCSAGTSGTTCTLSVAAPVGTDTFSVKTYGATNGGGAILDASAPITASIKLAKANRVAIALGPVVSTTADGGPGSLRYAIANANHGDTIAFLIPTGSTITVSSPITLASVTVSGPGFTYGSGNGYSGITLSGGGSQQIFQVPSGVTATLSGLVLENGNATVSPASGGAVWNDGTLTLLNDALVHNTTNFTTTVSGSACKLYEGGAVYNEGSLTVTGSTFDSNFATSSPFAGASCTWGDGGAIFNDARGTLADSGNVFTNNGAVNGGAIYNKAAGGTVQIAGDRFNGNTGCNSAALGCATSSCTGTGCASYGTGTGAAIYDAAGPGITIASAIFNGNIAGGGNGAAATTSLGVGGAIYSTVNLTLTNDVFTGNSASGDYGAQGGAVLENGGTLAGSGDNFASNAATGLGGTSCAPNAGGGGGAVLAQGATTFTNSNFHANTASGSIQGFGGAIYTGGATTITGGKFDLNAAVATSATASSSALGGAVDAVADLQITGADFETNQVTDNSSNAGQISGGAVTGTSSMEIGNTKFKQNQLTAVGSTGSRGFGGAVFAYGTLSTSANQYQNNSVVTGNEAVGGAVYSYATITSNSDSFASNGVYASQTGGGALTTYGTGNVTGASFTSNVSGSGPNVGVGGAVYDDGGIVFSGATMSQNSATAAGGAIYGAQSETIETSSFSGNSVSAAPTGYGGGAFASVSGTVNVYSSTFSNNTATLSSGTGGGGALLDSGTLLLSQSTVNNNVAGGSGAYDGGGLMLEGTAAIVNSTITGNQAYNGGGLINLGSGSVTLANDTIAKNSASANGGNVDLPSGTLNMLNTILAGGGASYANDLDATSTFNDDDYNYVQYTTGATFAGAHDKFGDPHLGSLANNGGPTQTIADSGSSGYNSEIPFTNGDQCAGISGQYAMEDQRGYTRGGNGYCDIGAFEYNGTAPAIRRVVHHPRPPLVRPHSRFQFKIPLAGKPPKPLPVMLHASDTKGLRLLGSAP